MNCPACGRPAEPADRFCFACGAPLGRASAPAAPPAAPPAPARWFDFILHPRQLFAHGHPPSWLVAILLVTILAVLDEFVNLVSQAHAFRQLEAAAQQFGIQLPAWVAGFLIPQSGLAVAIGALAGVAGAVVISLALYFAGAGLQYGLARWLGGARGRWSRFVRWYSLLTILDGLIFLVSVPSVVLMYLGDTQRAGIGQSAAGAMTLVVLLIAMVVISAVWLWKCLLRYLLLMVELRVPSSRALGIVIGLEAARFLAVLLAVVALAAIVFILLLGADPGSFHPPSLPI